jgi:hypothetical protein
MSVKRIAIALVFWMAAPLWATAYDTAVLSRSALSSFVELGDTVSSSTAADSKTSATLAVSGTITFGATSLCGDAQTSATFLGSGPSYLSYDASSRVDFTNTTPFSISAVIKPNFARASSGDGYTIISKTQADSTLRGYILCCRYSGSKARLNFFIINDFGNVNYIEVLGSTDLANATVWNVAVSYDGSQSAYGVKMKINGRTEIFTVEKDTLSATIASSATARIGYRSDAAWPFNGSMQYVAVYGGYLYPGQIATDTSNAGISIPAQPSVPSVSKFWLDADGDADWGDLAAYSLVNGVLNAYTSKSVVGISIDTSTADAVNVASASFDYYGRSTIPIYKGPVDITTPTVADWVAGIKANFAWTQGGAAATAAVSGLRTYLNGQADNSVVLICNGSLANFARFLSSASGADGINKTGLELEAKVNCYVVMGGIVEPGYVTWTGDNLIEYNWKLAPSDANTFFATATKPVLNVGFETGAQLFTGDTILDADPAEYASDSQGTATVEAWDQINAYVAMLGLGSNFYAEGGTMKVAAATGKGTWTPGSGTHYRILKTVADATIYTALTAYEGAPPLFQAVTPSPTNAATKQSLYTTLSWVAGEGAANHDVYFGTVNPPTVTQFKGNQVGLTYNPGTLALNTTYYWRVDEVNGVYKVEGTVWSFTTVATPVTYYVGPTGSNSNSKAQAQSTSTPWLTVAYAQGQASPGDTIFVRGGTYHEQVVLTNNGVLGAPITIKNYTAEVPVIDPTTALTGWEAAASDDPNLNMGGVQNAAWSHIYVTRTTMDPVQIYEDGTMLMMSASPDSSYQSWWRTEDMRAVPNEGGNYGQYAYIVDSTNFTQANDYWNGCYVAVHVGNQNNFIMWGTVTDFDAATHKITFTPQAGWTGTLSAGDQYAILNHPMIINKPGEWCVVASGGKYRTYLYPLNAADITAKIRRRDDATYATGGYFTIGSLNTDYGAYYVFDGLTVQDGVRGYEFKKDSGTPTTWPGVQIKNGTVTDIGGEGMYLYSLESGLITNMEVKAVSGEKGICLLSDCNNVRVTNNVVHDILGTAIYWAGNSKLTGVWGNTIYDTGTHGNCLTAYSNATDSLIARNLVYSTKCGITINGANTVTIFENIFYNVSSAYADWGDSNGVIGIYHNVMQGVSSIAYGEAGSGTGEHASNTVLRVVDNIGKGPAYGSATIHTYNVWTSTPGCANSTGEVTNTDLAAIFIDATNHNYHLKGGSPALEIGGVPSAYMTTVIAQFPDFDFTKDYEGTTWNSPVDAGAYEDDTPAGPSKATTPLPADAAVNQLITVVLSWTNPGVGTSFNVYVGTDIALTAPGDSKGNQPGTTYAAGTFVAGRTYYWRVDAVIGGVVATGDTWSFSTVSGADRRTGPRLRLR